MNPPAKLREHLADARRAGVSFEQAWPIALEATVGTVQWERAEWLEALSNTVKEWREGWERRPSTGPALEALPGGVPLPERACELCGAEVPAERDVKARYCSDGCAKRAAYLRERERA